MSAHPMVDHYARARLRSLEERLAFIEAPVALSPVLPRDAIERITRAVAAAFDVPAEEIAGVPRARQVAQARHAVALLIRRRHAYSLPRIGRLTRRDHTTVLNSLRRAEALAREDPDFAARLERAVATLDHPSEERG